jgi:hypothetical protein
MLMLRLLVRARLHHQQADIGYWILDPKIKALKIEAAGLGVLRVRVALTYWIMDPIYSH